MWNYKEVRIEGHHRQRSNGMVLEHIYESEIMIGRKLKDGEVVHHIDEDASNNSHDNLMVFKTQSEHARFHKTGICEITNDGSYISPKISYGKCKICDNDIFSSSNTTYCSAKCCKSDISRRKVKNRPSKEELSEMIDSMSWLAIGRKYSVSDNAVRKWARKYDLI